MLFDWLIENASASCVQVVLVALPGVDLDTVQSELDRQCDALPRGDTARHALSHSCVVRVDSKVGHVSLAEHEGYPADLSNCLRQGSCWVPGKLLSGPQTAVYCCSSQFSHSLLSSYRAPSLRPSQHFCCRRRWLRSPTATRR